MKFSKAKKLVAVGILAATLLASLTSCGFLDMVTNDIHGSLIGNSYNCEFYDYDALETMHIKGDKISMSGVETEDEEGNTTLTSVVELTVDGKQVVSCGDTIVFASTKLDKELDFNTVDIDSSAKKLTDNAYLARSLNKYKNMFGKSMIVVIKTQSGKPICAYSGKEVTWKVCDDLPKTTKLSIDGNPLYIHRGTYQIIDASLLADN